MTLMMKTKVMMICKTKMIKIMIMYNPMNTKAKKELSAKENYSMNDKALPLFLSISCVTHQKQHGNVVLMKWQKH